jgi:RNA polymerase sigma-70 factor (ECF subfamily)
VSLNMLRSRRTHREESLGVQMPEPIVDRTDGTDPAHEALLADSVGLALLVVLETLTPPERLAFVLHDMFGVPFDEIAPIVDRSPDAARQLASRARRRVRGRASDSGRRSREAAQGRRSLPGCRAQG